MPFPMRIDVPFKRLKYLNFLRSSFSKNVLTLMTGSIIAQAIQILIYPVLTRIYTPENFGAFAIYMSIASTISVIATARYELAIMLPEDDRDSINLVSLSIHISLLLSCMVFCIIYIYRNRILDLFNVPELSLWLYFISITVLLNGIYQTLSYLFNRDREYKLLSSCRVTQSLGTLFTNLSLGFAGFGTAGLVIGSITGQVAVSGLMGWKTFQNKKYKMIYISYQSMKDNLVKYIDFPKKSTPGIMLNVLSSQFVIFLIGILYNTRVPGFYSLTLTILNAPIMLIGKSVSQVFYQKATNAKKDGELQQLVKNITKNLFLIILLPMTVLVIFGDHIFKFVFGTDWVEAGKITQIMAPFFLIRFVFSSQSTLMIVKKRLDFEFKFNLFLLLTQIGAVLSGYYFFSSYYYSFIFMSISGFVLYLILGIWIIRRSRE